MEERGKEMENITISITGQGAAEKKAKILRAVYRTLAFRADGRSTVQVTCSQKEDAADAVRKKVVDVPGFMGESSRQRQERLGVMW